MLYVNDTHFTRSYFDDWFAKFDAEPLIAKQENKRIAIRTQDSAFWLALCLYAKEHQFTVFPLTGDMPLSAAQRRAERAGCEILFFGEDANSTLAGVSRLDVAISGLGSAPGLIQTSSGTTGEPKFIERTWTSIDFELDAYLEHFTLESESMIIACPVTHSYGLISGVLASIVRGKPPIVVSNLNPKYLLRKVGESPSSVLYASPTLLTTMAMLAPGQLSASVMTSGSPLQKSWFDKVKNKVRHVHQQYGCSEVGCISLGQDVHEPTDLGAPLPHLRVRAGDTDKDPKEIVVTLSNGDSVETRDLGYFHEGRLQFVSRIDDMIDVSGLNVYPAEVEEVVLQLPEIEDAVVFSGERRGSADQVCLHFVSSQPVSGAQIRAWCSTRLARHQMPMLIEQVEHIARLPNGKISRRALSESALTPQTESRTSGVHS